MGPLYWPIEDKVEREGLERGGGGGVVVREIKGSEGGVVETVQKTCPSLLANRGWKCELGATKGPGLHRTANLWVAGS